jgi:hypothetical protein
MNKTLLFFIGIVMIGILPARAERAVQGLYTYNSFGASFHPLGILVDNRLFMRQPLYAKNGMLWESAKFDIGLQSSWTPADELFCLRAVLEPIAFFSLSATAGVYGMYSGFGYGYFPFDSPHDRYGPGLPKDRTPRSVGGTWLSLAPEVRLKAGRCILVNTITVNAVTLDYPGYFLELRSFTLHKTKDIDIADDVNFLFEFNKRFIAGCVYRYLFVDGTEIKSHRLSLMAVHLFPKARIGDAFAAIVAGYYPVDPAFKGMAYLGMMAGTELKLRRR